MIIYNILGIEIGLSLKAFNEQKEKLLTQEERLLDLERRLNLCKYLNNVKKLSYVRYNIQLGINPTLNTHICLFLSKGTEPNTRAMNYE